MVQFRCDNKNIEILLSKLCNLLEKSGTYFHKNLLVAEEKGQFSIAASDLIKNDLKIVVLPESCFIPIDSFKLHFKNDSVSIDSYSKDVPAYLVETLEIVLGLYNCAGKIADHKKTSLFSLFFENREMFGRLLSRYDFDLFQVMDVASDADRDCVIGQSFMKLRTFSPTLQAVSKETEGKNIGYPQRVLFPFIEYFNHHPAAKSIALCLDEGEQYRSEQVKSFSIRGSDQLFIKYGFYDTHELFVTQGYVDEQVMFFRSLPLEIDLADMGTINVKASVAKVKNENHPMPKEIRDLRFFIPQIRGSFEKRTVDLSYLLLPPKEAPVALRRVLQLVINGMTDKPEQVWPAVLYAETQIIQKNFEYYKNLLEDICRYKPLPATEIIMENARKMAEIQLQKIKDYAFFEEAMARP